MLSATAFFDVFLLTAEALYWLWVYFDIFNWSIGLCIVLNTIYWSNVLEQCWTVILQHPAADDAVSTPGRVAVLRSAGSSVSTCK